MFTFHVEVWAAVQVVNKDKLMTLSYNVSYDWQQCIW